VHSKQKSLIVISAPSGAGKTTLCQKLLRDFPNVALSISSTTRDPRGTEKHGVEYFFLTPEEFQKRIQDNGFAEWASVHGNYYGTSKEMIEKAFSTNQAVLLDIDVQGAAQLRKSYPNQSLLIFISPPSLEVLETRLRARKTDSKETIQRRLKNAAQEMSEMNKFDAVIINDDLGRAYEELSRLIETRLGLKKAKAKTER
jgi:guanylate kinase